MTYKDCLQKISFLEFNDHEALILNAEFDKLGSFCHLLDDFEEAIKAPSSHYGLFFNRLMNSTDHWPCDQLKQLKELPKIKGHGKLLGQVVEGIMMDWEKVYRLLVSMSSLINKKSMLVNTIQLCHIKNGGTSSEDDKYLVLELTQTLQKVFSSEHRDETFNAGLEQLKYGNFTLESYNSAKQLGMTIMKERCYKLLQQLTGHSLMVSRVKAIWGRMFSTFLVEVNFQWNIISH